MKPNNSFPDNIIMTNFELNKLGVCFSMATEMDDCLLKFEEHLFRLVRTFVWDNP